MIFDGRYRCWYSILFSGCFFVISSKEETVIYLLEGVVGLKVLIAIVFPPLTINIRALQIFLLNLLQLILLVLFSSLMFFLHFCQVCVFYHGYSSYLHCLHLHQRFFQQLFLFLLYWHFLLP